ncbi:MAG TPA: YggS family pyridoxal phosphate-dependent enzyme [Acidimicrobiia bacterium]|nr:YggS family pyridoxal phosphate-dependent enzyme [Acidimicrobiia bacterium]
MTGNLAAVIHRIAAAAKRVDRDPADVTLVVVGKGQPASALRALYDEGHRDFGENRAQELVAKVEELPADVRWHFIGPLQSNKVRLVRPVVRLLHSFDRLDLASAWVKGPGLPPPVLVQVNIGDEPQKHGVRPEATREVVAELEAKGVPVRGLMAIPPLVDDPEESRVHYRRMASLLVELQQAHPFLKELSMGMTDDFEVAVEEGATFLRVGRAIFAATEH